MTAVDLASLLCMTLCKGFSSELSIFLFAIYTTPAVLAKT